MQFALLLTVFAGTCLAQLQGIIDIHLHGDPDSVARKLDVLDEARMAREEGMRAIMLKNHYAPTYPLAYIVSRAVPGVESYGGVVLNLPVGGINMAAVEQAMQFKGGYARMVWMPTFDSENQVRSSKQNRPFVSVSKDGRLLPEVIAVLQYIGKHPSLALATGHSTPAEDLMLIRAAREAGISKIVVTHPTASPVFMSLQQMQEAAKLGAYLEFCSASVLPGPTQDNHSKLEEYVQNMHALGADHCILSSDLGQPSNPVPTAGWRTYLDILQKAGITPAEINMMARRNPARLLGLE
jgi:Family of unknown function (DUF6282)